MAKQRTSIQKQLDELAKLAERRGRIRAQQYQQEQDLLEQTRQEILEKKKAELEAKKNWGDEAMQGAATGATVGGPWGALIGGAIGSLKGQRESYKARKKEAGGGLHGFAEGMMSALSPWHSLPSGGAQTGAASVIGPKMESWKAGQEPKGGDLKDEIGESSVAGEESPMPTRSDEQQAEADRFRFSKKPGSQTEGELAYQLWLKQQQSRGR